MAHAFDNLQQVDCFSLGLITAVGFLKLRLILTPLLSPSFFSIAGSLLAFVYTRKLSRLNAGIILGFAEVSLPRKRVAYSSEAAKTLLKRSVMRSTGLV